MAQYGGEQLYKKEEGHHTDGHVHNAPLHSTTATGHEIGATGTNIHTTTEGHGIGGNGTTTIGTGAGHGYEEAKHGEHGGAGGFLHRSGSGSSSSSEDDGEGGRRKKKGVVEKIKEKLPGGDHGSDEQKTAAPTLGSEGHGYEGEQGHEKKGLMEKIKDKLPGGGH